jgi:hypothetical protein
MFLELGMDNVKKFVDFNADVITSLLVVFRAPGPSPAMMRNQTISHCQIAADLDDIQSPCL